MSRTFAYCRVSTTDQTTANQVAEIKAAGFDVASARIVEETVSGSVAAKERSGFQKLMERLEAGDVLIITKLDRLGRDAIDVSMTVRALANAGVKVHCLALGGVDLTSSAGAMTMHVLNAVAQFERDLIIERTQAGLKRAKAEGKRLGRPSSLSVDQQKAVLADLAAGASVSATARKFGTTRQTILRVEAAAGDLGPTAPANVANISPARPEASIRADEAYQRLTADYQATGMRRPPWLIEADIEIIRAVDPTVAQQWKTALLG